MIKFNCLIHKETGTVIKYEDWVNCCKDDLEIKFVKIMHNPYIEKKYGGYKAKEILFSDDFEIIYENEFTLQELANIFSKDYSKELSDKILKISMDKAVLKDKYGIEV